MYADPSHIKQHPRTIKLSDHQARKFELLAELLGKQPATLIRELAEEAADARIAAIGKQSMTAAG